MNFYDTTLPYLGAVHTGEPTTHRQSPLGYFPRYLSLRPWRSSQIRRLTEPFIAKRQGRAVPPSTDPHANGSLRWAG